MCCREPFVFNSEKNKHFIKHVTTPHLLPNFKCMRRNARPVHVATEPTTMYAMPRKEFFPPSHDVVVMITCFSPPNDETGYAVSDVNHNKTSSESDFSNRSLLITQVTDCHCFTRHSSSHQAHVKKCGAAI